MIYIGIDPGVTGGIAYIDGLFNEVYPMPSTEQEIVTVFKTIMDKRRILGDTTRYYEPIKALIEQVHAMPQQGVTSMFTFGRNYGFLRGILVTMQIPFEEVSPQKWQKYYGLKREKDEEKRTYKNRILQKAQNMFPVSRVALQTADALMIAEYLRKTEER